jgi:3-methyladenine DNA glycosylase Tag
MEAPKQITPKRLDDYLEEMSKVVFQSGMSWAIINKKWPDIREAFEGFDALAVASFTTKKLNALQDDPRVIRNRRKLDGIVHNARTMIELEEQHGSFKKYLRSHDDFEACAKDLRKRFKFVGDFGAFRFLYVVKEQVPDYEVWCASRGRTPMMA